MWGDTHPRTPNAVAKSQPRHHYCTTSQGTMRRLRYRSNGSKPPPTYPILKTRLVLDIRAKASRCISFTLAISGRGPCLQSWSGVD
jgi:hypothetical protein